MSEINCFGDEQIFGRVVKGWSLVRLVNKIPKTYTVNGFEVKEGTWGLTNVNDPSFVFDLPPLEDPTLKDEDAELSNEYLETIEHYEDRLNAHVTVGHQLVEACVHEGYNPNEDSFACWLCHKMWLTLEGCDWKPIKEYKR